LHDRPLLDALEHGFTSVEADIFLVLGVLAVAHEEHEIQMESTLQTLYLDPLRERIEANSGAVYQSGPSFTLLIDIKSDAEATYLALHEALASYRDILTTYGPNGMEAGPIQVIISGNRPRELMATQTVRYAGYDGRLTDLESPAPTTFIPLISDRWTSTFTWNGEGPIPPDQRQKLRDIVERVHAAGRRVRFWATPDTPGPAREAVWQELIAAGVDLINTDDLRALQRFLADITDQGS
jgi:glycerophosphoryl diester phosphodiesterase